MTSKKDKPKSQSPTGKSYKFYSLDEMKAKEIKYMERIMELKKCANFVEDALQEVYCLNENQLLLDKWNDFLSCSPLPRPYLPPDIRLFQSKLKHWEKESVDKTINWLLTVNEKSILSQDLIGKDVTRRKLHDTLKKNIGHEYNNYIRDYLNVLRRIYNFLDDGVALNKCPNRILDDITKQKSAIQQEIMHFIDRFTYRIISSENAEMTSIDATTAEYSFRAYDFVIHLWCLKNVAIRFSYLSEPRLLANFSSINLQLYIPAQMLKENLVIRAVHMDFDHLSEYGKSFKSPLATSTKNLPETDLDLHKCLLNEWAMQVDMQNKKLNEIKEKCLEYEALKQQYEEQMLKQKQNSKEGKKTKKLIKMPKYPLFIQDNMVPDIEEDFLVEEEMQYENIVRNALKPELLNLSKDQPFKINLRKYGILGGVYQLYYVQKPLNVDFIGFNMTWHENKTKLVVERNIHIKKDSLHNNDFSRRTSFKRMSVNDLNKKLSEPDINSPWFILTFQLPEYLCYWTDPIACQFEEITEKKNPSPLIETTELEQNTKKSQLISHSSSQHDIQLLNTSDPKMIHKPSLVSENSLYDYISKEHRKSLASSATSFKSLHIDDFSLVDTLTNSQLKHIEKHILPRIISSYKFPKEMTQEDSEFLNNKPKGKGGRILRQNVEEIPRKLSLGHFTCTERQNHPERIYTKYPRVNNIHIRSFLKEIICLDDQESPKTFAQLLQIINNIKEKYKTNKNYLLDLKPLKKKIVTQNKKIKQVLSQKKQNYAKIASAIDSQSRKPSAHKSLELDTVLETNESAILGETELQDEKEENLFTETESLVVSDALENAGHSDVMKIMHWTTKHILKYQFDRKNRKIVIHTDRLGYFGFALQRYEHFPFKNWSLEPYANDPDNEVVFTLDTQYVRCVLNITANGIRGHVTEPSTSFISKPKMYLTIENPIEDFKALKHLFKEKHLNIFAEQDAGFYIENGYFSEKHLPSELHTYNCMAVHSTQMRFKFSLWNRLATRRNIILKFIQYQDIKENLVEVRIVPGEAFFVEVQELCSEDLDVIKLDYNLTWRNIETYSDLHHLIVSMYPAATDLRCKNPKLLCFIKDLLSEIRPLSFS